MTHDGKGVSGPVITWEGRRLVFAFWTGKERHVLRLSRKEAFAIAAKLIRVAMQGVGE